MLVQKIMPRQLRGFTLTEAAIVLGIVGLILGAIWVAASAVYNNMRVTTTTTQILQMAQAIRSIHATQQTIPGLTTAAGAVALAKAGAVPKDMLDNPLTPTTVTSIWNNTVTIESNSNLSTDDSFLITYTSVPREACADLLVRLTGPGRDGGLVSAGTTPVLAAAMPITVLTAVNTECNATTNNLEFTFMLKG